MALSNTTLATLNATPYFDDFTSSKRFHRILHKPKLPVQTRELNSVQSLLQNQIGELGAGVFKEGAAVVGGNAVFANNVIALQVVRNDDIDIDNFYDTTTGVGHIVRGATSGAEARVVQVARQSSEDYSAVIVVPMAANEFAGSESLSFVDSTTNSTTALMVSAPSPVQTRNAAIYSIQEGTFFLRGHLVHVDQQTIVLSSNTNVISARVGFVVEEEIITYRDDSSLLDPALGTTNYAAPGADRLRLTAVLTSKAISGSTQVEQNSDEDFIEISRIVDGVPAVNFDRIEPTQVEEILARRTYDESGDYVVRPFRLTTKPHNPPISTPNSTGTISGNTTSTTIIAGGVPTLFQTEVGVGDVLVVNGERRAVASISTNTALVVNNAFSVDFSNTTFTIVSDDKMNLELESGKAYVRGREFETVGTTILQVDKPRTSNSIEDGVIGTFYGPFVYVTKANGDLFLTNTLESVDLHSVGFSSINVSANTYASTKIGTARVRSFNYAAGTGDANTIYKMGLVGAQFQTKNFTVVGGVTDAGLTSLAINASGKFVTLVQNASGTTMSLLPTADHAYVGSSITMYGADGSELSYFVVSSNSSTTANQTTVNCVLNSNAYFDKINTTANVVFTFTDKSIRGFANANTKTKGASVDVLSKLGNIATGNTVLFGADSTSTLFKLRESWVVPTSFDISTYDAMRLFTAQTGASFNSTHMKYTLTLTPVIEQFEPTATGAVYTNFLVANNDGDSVHLTSTDTSVGISGNQAELYLPKTAVGDGANTITVIAKIIVTDTPHSKILYTANTDVASVDVSGADLVSNTNNNMGHIGINVINTASNNVVSLGIPDVYALKKVYAVPDATDTGTWVDVTDRYTLDNGQRNWCYDHASIVLRPGYGHHTTATRALVMVDRFEHNYNGTFFTAGSYQGSGLSDEYVDIPVYRDPISGTAFSLRDYLDCRAVRTADVASANTATNPYTNASAAVFTTTGVNIPNPDGTTVLSYDYYLPRIDKVVLTKSKELKVIQGLPSKTPMPPADPENSMTLYIVKYPPYVANTELIQVQSLDHRRYTMRDIGKLEKRIEHLEYYVSLSLLEERTLNQPELDGDDIERFKNGILIDPFSSYAIANASDLDYRASIDRSMRELRPGFVSYGFHLNSYVPGSSSNTVKKGTGLDDVVMLEYTSNTFISQPLASTSVNINPFNVASWRGRLILSPSTDQWMDTLSRGTVTINLFDENSNWTGANPFGFGTVWGDWQDNWSGQSIESNESVVFGTAREEGDPDVREQWFKTTTTETIVSQTNTPWRSGQQIFANMNIVTKQLGDKVIDISVAPFMRSANVVISATSLKPNSNLIAFFDEKDVTNLVERANEIRVANSAVASSFVVGETLTSNVVGANAGSAIVAGIINDSIKVVNTHGRFFEVGGNVNVTGATSGATAKVSEYVSFSGKLTGAPSTSNVALDSGAFTVAGAYVGNVIHITSGVGVGQRATITDYDGNGYAEVSPAFTVLPAANSTYSIGSLVTDGLELQSNSGIGYSVANASSIIPGSFYGLFRLPGTTRSVDANNVETLTTPTIAFNTGRRVFRLTDNATSQYANTMAEGPYEASGLTKVVENQVVATREISYSRGPVITQTGSPVTSTTSSSSTETDFTGVYVDPLAQTFIIDASRYSNGVFVTSVDLFFASKDPANIPVTVQIRPTENGYPSADKWLVESTIPSGTGNNAVINVIPVDTTPNPANTSHVTRFEFPQPVYLLPGQEYAIVIMSNSFKYEVMVGQIGEQIIGDTRIISEQPYGGSFFKSQNARTWTAEQNQDLMFVLNKATFETTGTAAFKLGETTNSSSYGTDAAGNFDFDLINIQTGHLEFPPTANATAYTIQLTNASDESMNAFGSPRIEQDLELDQRKRIVAANSTCVDFRATLGTTDPNVSPVYDLGRISLITIRNIVDNGQLYSNSFTIINPGAGFTPGTFVITANDTYGTGSLVTATVNSIGQVSSVVVTTNGSGYIETPTLSWAASHSTNAVIDIRGETSPAVQVTGEQKARYISRRVTLADGFDASDLKVYISANRLPGTNVDVYYKVLATGDVEQFDNKNWTRMIVKSGQENKYATNSNQFNEYEYRTAANTAAYTSNSVTFDRFHTFAVKLVLRSEDSSIVPRLRNLRAIALDE